MRRVNRVAGLATGRGRFTGQPPSPTATGRPTIARIAAKRVDEPIEPKTLGNMRANGVRSLDVSWQCHHRAIAVDHRRASRGRTGRSRRRRKPDVCNGGETTKGLAGHRGETGAPAARRRAARVLPKDMYGRPPLGKGSFGASASGSGAVMYPAFGCGTLTAGPEGVRGRVPIIPARCETR
jgi:hypothetical protein